MPAPFHDLFRNRRVLVTGHTGFKGAWLSEWLLALGAEVHGYALDPLPHALLFDQLNLHHRIAADHRADIMDRAHLAAVTRDTAPDFVFHLAAQPLVRLSYDQPVETFAVNVMGSVHMLDALRLAAHPCTVIMVTTDKCYENREWLHPYRESDPMGGHDPYSASKGAAEIAIAAYRRSFFDSPDSPVRVASARAGNVIGGGDWAPDRIVPDAIRALAAGEPIGVRNPLATRPWQHVLEPLCGYLRLAEALALEPDPPCEPFNFGPSLASNRPVQELVSTILNHLPGRWLDQRDPAAPHEANLLHLQIDKAHHRLGWQPRWNYSTTVQRTVEWYQQYHQGHSALECCLADLTAYLAINPSHTSSTLPA
jgi:CDP-glucose 4,6-dehydratase